MGEGVGGCYVGGNKESCILLVITIRICVELHLLLFFTPSVASMWESFSKCILTKYLN